MNCNCKNTPLKAACGHCSKLRVVFLISSNHGKVRNPVYYSFFADERKIKNVQRLATNMLQRLVKKHKGVFFRVDVYDNLTEGKPKLFEYKPEELKYHKKAFNYD